VKVQSSRCNGFVFDGLDSEATLVNAPFFGGVSEVVNLQTPDCALDVLWNSGTTVCDGPVRYFVYRDTVSPVLPSWNIATVPDPFVPAYDNAAAVPGETAAPLSLAPDERVEPGASGTALSPVGRKPWIRRLNWFLVVWGVGASILLLRLIGGKTYGWRIATAAPKVEDERLLGAVRRVAERLGITHPIPVVESDHLKVPFVWGLFRHCSDPPLLPVRNRIHVHTKDFSYIFLV